MCGLPAGVIVLIFSLVMLNILGWGMCFLLQHKLIHAEEAYDILMHSKEWHDG